MDDRRSHTHPPTDTTYDDAYIRARPSYLSRSHHSHIHLSTSQILSSPFTRARLSRSPEYSPPSWEDIYPRRGFPSDPFLGLASGNFLIDKSRQTTVSSLTRWLTSLLLYLVLSLLVNIDLLPPPCPPPTCNFANLIDRVRSRHQPPRRLDRRLTSILPRPLAVVFDTSCLVNLHLHSTPWSTRSINIASIIIDDLDVHVLSHLAHPQPRHLPSPSPRPPTSLPPLRTSSRRTRWLLHQRKPCLPRRRNTLGSSRRKDTRLRRSRRSPW